MDMLNKGWVPCQAITLHDAALHSTPTSWRMHLQAKKHLGPKLIGRAAEMGIEIKPVHVGRPLEEQGPFDVLLHKVRRKGEFPIS